MSAIEMDKWARTLHGINAMSATEMTKQARTLHWIKP